MLLFLTYLRVLRSGVSLTQIKSDLMYPLTSQSSSTTTSQQEFLQSGSPGIEFSNNKIKIRKENPCKLRDTLILKSCTGALLGLCSVTGALFSLCKLLPAIYTNACHWKHSWVLTAYPGATFALIESLISISCLALLLVAVLLTAILGCMPRFFLHTLPSSCRRCRRRVTQ